jgi:hypothetical protein
MIHGATDQKPKFWVYILASCCTLLIVTPLWTFFVMVFIQPESLMTQEQTMSSRILWWLALPMIVVAVVFGSRWIFVSKTVQAKLLQSAVTTDYLPSTDHSKREYVLEVIGLGATLDKYRQGALWTALQNGNPYMTIREQDRKKYPWSDTEKMGISGGRGGDSLENGAQYTPMYYGVPVFNAEPPVHNTRMIDTPDDPLAGLAGSNVSSGMAWHLFVVGPRRFDEHPDRILEDVFTFFDSHPDVPYIVLNSDDSMTSRDSYRAEGMAALVKDGYYIPEMPDTSTLFVLARRERVDAIRPFVWDDPDNKFVQEEFRAMYYQLVKTIPFPGRVVTRTPAQAAADPDGNPENDGNERQPLIQEWLEGSGAFAQRPDIRGTAPVSLIDAVKSHWENKPPKEWKPTPWFPIPWNTEQLATFDRLPTLGFIHRPTFVKFADEHGKPITRRDERDKILQAGWQAALLTLPEAERAKAPALIVAATAGNTQQMTMLHSTLNAYAARGGPEIDTGNSAQFIDTDKRLGNTGATTLFMQMAIGVMGSYRNGGISAAVNLRNKGEASIVFISPPSDEKRKTQKHPRGGDVFAHRGSPAINPADYK